MAKKKIEEYSKDHVKQILMERDGLSAEEAQGMIDRAKEEMDEYLEHDNIEDAQNICEDHFGLEPDFLMAFMDMS